MNETTKAKQYWGAIEHEATRGQGIDIGCGPDPVMPNVRRFDLEHGDANFPSQHIKEQFDFVYSSHCLEHMHDPRFTILDWWKLVRPGGYLFILVPDEDLYEQGVFPSRFNHDHKATFTISKAQSWSPKSINVLDLAHSLPGGRIVSLELQDRGYDRSLMSFGKLQPGIFIKLIAKLSGLLQKMTTANGRRRLQRLLVPYFPIDQTSAGQNTQAQIQLIVKKASDE
jgi:SAM-dependent methyltransferase